MSKKDWEIQLENCKDNIDRALLAQNLSTDPELLKVFCFYDLDPMVVEEAILNPNTEDHWAERGIDRFSQFDSTLLWEKRSEKRKEELKRLEEEGGKYISGDRDQIILKHILKEDNLEIPELNHANSHLGKPIKKVKSNFKKTNKPWEDTEKFRIAMIMPPAWGILFPPYNLAKLVSVLRAHGYSTKVYDANIESYHRLMESHGEDYWRGERYFLWTVKENFNKFILPYIKPLLDDIVNELVESNPKVIGFSIYNTNLNAVTYMVREIRKKLPETCLIAGGPEVVTGSAMLRMFPFNYFFVGEAEETLPYVLENLPKVYPSQEIIGSTDSKLKLEEFPYPDYSDYNLKNYMHQDGVSIETSRGCVAQCSFCAETYFWKFRSSSPERVVEEMEYQIKTYGVKRFWFVDSLVNGNLKSFEKLVDLIIEKKLNIKWNSYARCDGRMTKEFIKKIVKSGCTCLSYGVESGSQKVLHDMRKKIEVWEIENNLNHGAEMKLYNHVNWMLGFPTERPIDFLHSLQLTANVRKSINVISPGFGAGAATASHMATDWQIYGIVGDNFVGDRTLLNSWYTSDYQNTILHRFLRIKMFHIWLEILEKKAGSYIENGQRYDNIQSFYDFSSNKSTKIREEYHEYTKLDRLDPADYKNSITNEYFTLAYALFLYFGKYSFKMTCSPDIDQSTFGNSLVNNYTSTFNVKVDDQGNYSINISHSLKHEALDKQYHHVYEGELNTKNLSFVFDFNENGNFNNWISEEKQTKETVHEQYRNKPKKIIHITT